jgi:hypothetical protein
VRTRGEPEQAQRQRGAAVPPSPVSPQPGAPNPSATNPLPNAGRDQDDVAVADRWRCQLGSVPEPERLEALSVAQRKAGRTDAGFVMTETMDEFDGR